MAKRLSKISGWIKKNPDGVIAGAALAADAAITLAKKIRKIRTERGEAKATARVLAGKEKLHKMSDYEIKEAKKNKIAFFNEFKQAGISEADATAICNALAISKETNTKNSVLWYIAGKYNKKISENAKAIIYGKNKMRRTFYDK